MADVNNECNYDRTCYERLIGLVDMMHSFQEKSKAAKTTHERTVLQRQITATDRQIDQLVYELYGLTEEEIAIVEGATA